MLVKFRTNLGSNDARPLSLNYTECCRDMERDVPDNVGRFLIAKHLADEVRTIKGEAKPAPLTGKFKKDE